VNAKDFVDHDLQSGQKPGREGYMQAVAEEHAAFSDIRYVIEKQLAEGDEVVTRAT
jgi:predicted ester cyclase